MTQVQMDGYGYSYGWLSTAVSGHLFCLGPLLTLLGPQSRFGDNSLGIRLVCTLIGTAVLKGLTTHS